MREEWKQQSKCPSLLLTILKTSVPTTLKWSKTKTTSLQSVNALIFNDLCNFPPTTRDSYLPQSNSRICLFNCNPTFYQRKCSRLNLRHVDFYDSHWTEICIRGTHVSLCKIIGETKIKIKTKQWEKYLSVKGIYRKLSQDYSRTLSCHLQACIYRRWTTYLASLFKLQIRYPLNPWVTLACYHTMLLFKNGFTIILQTCLEEQKIISSMSFNSILQHCWK